MSRVFVFIVHSFFHYFYHVLFTQLFLESFLLRILNFFSINPFLNSNRFHLEKKFAHSQETTVICEPNGKASEFFDISPGFKCREGDKLFYDAPKYGPHYSTIFSAVVKESAQPTVGELGITREIVEVDNGNVDIALDFLYPPEYFHSEINPNKKKPKMLVVICPGLNSDTNSEYIRGFLATLKKLNNENSGASGNVLDAVVVNQRGYSGMNLKPGSPPMCAGLTSDLRTVIYKYLNPTKLRSRYQTEKAPFLCLSSFSMGSNVSSKFLAEEGEKIAVKNIDEVFAGSASTSSLENNKHKSKEEYSNLKGKMKNLASARTKNDNNKTSKNTAPNNDIEDEISLGDDDRPQILCAFAIACPWSLVGATRTLASGLSYIYELTFLAALKKMIHTNFGKHTDNKNQEETRVNSEGVLGEACVMDYDENHIAPLHGFKSAAHYYADSQAFDRLETVAIPLFALVALEDPICGIAKLDEKWHRICTEVNTNICYARAPSGGHIGSLNHPFDELRGRSSPFDRMIVDEMLKPILNKL